MVFHTKNLYHIVVSIFFTLSIISVKKVSAQRLSPSEEYNKYAGLYPDENVVVTDKWSNYNISLVGDSLSITREEYKEVLILNNPAGWVKDRVYSSSFNEITKVEAYTLVPAKKKYKRVEVEDFKKSYDKNTYVFYDDTEIINYSYPEICKGCKIVTRQQYRLNNPHTIGQFFFSSYRPTIHARLRIVTDSLITIKHGLFNQDLEEIKFKTAEIEGGKREYIYWAENLEKIEHEDNSPSFNHLSTSAYLTISHYSTNGKEVFVMSSLEDLHKWYLGFIKKQEVDPAISELAKSIVNVEDDDYEKIRKIFYWVQSNVKYIAFEDGMRGFIPHLPGYVLQKRYGDCKDMSSLLIGLLRSQGIPANYTWIGTRDLPYKYSKTPSPAIDNHMIASVEYEGGTIFLDATGAYTPIGFPTSMIQGKESLVSDDGKPKIVNVEVVPKEMNSMVDTSYVTLNNGVISGKAHLQLTGLAKVANTYKLIDKTKNGEEDYLKRLLSKGSNKFYLDRYGTRNVEDLDKPIKIDYDFRIDDYYRSIGDEVYINLCLDKSLTNDLILDRSIPIENDYKYIHTNVTILDLPEGYTISYLPENSTLDSDYFGYSITYKQIGNRLYASKEFYVDYLLMYPEDFEKWNESIREYAQAVRNTVVLTKNNN